MTHDEKYEIVKGYYERAYHVRFKTRPDDKQIDWLYAEMQKLAKSLALEFERARPELLRLLQSPTK